MYWAKGVETSIGRFGAFASQFESERHVQKTLPPNTATTHGLAVLPAYDASAPVDLDDLLAARETQHALLELLAVEYVVLPIGDPGDTVDHRPELIPLGDPVPGARLYRLPHTLPRIYLAGHSEVWPDDQAPSHVLAPDVVAGRSVMVAPGATAEPGEPGNAGDCSLQSFSATRIVADCRAERRAVAVFVEQYGPNWTAEVDHDRVPLLRANLVMRAVNVPPGSHRVTLSYEAPSLRSGLALSLVSLLALLMLVALPRGAVRRVAVDPGSDQNR
jgi:hypothetical protein